MPASNRIIFVCLMSITVILPAVHQTSSTAEERKNQTEPRTAKPTVPGPAAPAGMAVPEYNEQGALLRPEGFERWIVVGTSVGLSYSDDPKKTSDDPGQFHNVYMQPQAFDHYVRTGEFPEQTIFVVTNNPSAATKGKDSLNRAGFFASPSTGLEVAVRDTKRFADGWAYFMYHNSKPETAAESNPVSSQAPKERQAEMAFPRAACYDCHAEHGAVDNVFTQFYSVLSRARETHLAGADSSGP